MVIRMASPKARKGARSTGAAANRRAAVAAHREELAVTIRADILDAALRAFARQGHAAVTMKDIANEAGYTAGALYSYFKNKDAIIVGIVEMIMTATMQILEAPVTPGVPFERKVELLLRGLMGLADQRRDAFRLMMALHTDPKAVPPQLREGSPGAMRGKMHARMTRWLEENAGKGDLGGEGAENIASLLLGMTSGLASRWMMSPGEPAAPLAASAPLVARVLFHGIHGEPVRAR